MVHRRALAMRNIAPILFMASCGSVIVDNAAGGTTGAGGARDGGASSMTAASSSSSGQTVDAGGDDGSVDGAACASGTEVSLCDPLCDVAAEGACACDQSHAPNCPLGWWKVCCAGNGKPCGPPVYVDVGVEIIPACGPGAAPAWCVSYPYACHQ